MATDKLVDFDHVTDYISREAALFAVVDAVQSNDNGFRWGEIVTFTGGDIIKLIKSIPAADVRPVVLCRDCRWWTKQENSLQGRCELAGFYPTGAWFCANGERPNCGADMRESNLDTTKGDNHD